MITEFPETNKGFAETESEANDMVPIQKSKEKKSGKSLGSAESKKAEAEDNIEIGDDVALTFPQRLMEILDNEAYADIIAWLPHGRGFVIFRKKAFELKILPKHFHKQSKFSSFTRKLNRWSYVRVTRGPETGSYYNEFFRRDGHRLCMQMSCQSSTKFSGASTSNVVAPDFSRVPTVVPSVDSGMYPHNPDTTFQLALAEEAAMQQARHLAQLKQAQGIPMEHRAMSSQESMFLQAMAGRDAPGSLSLAQLVNMNGNPSFFGATTPFQMPHQF